MQVPVPYLRIVLISEIDEPNMNRDINHNSK
jgi:hypothetical protein